MLCSQLHRHVAGVEVPGGAEVAAPRAHLDGALLGPRHVHVQRLEGVAGVAEEGHHLVLALPQRHAERVARRTPLVGNYLERGHPSAVGGAAHVVHMLALVHINRFDASPSVAPCADVDGASGLVDVGEGEANDAASRGFVAIDGDADKALWAAVAVDRCRKVFRWVDPMNQSSLRPPFDQDPTRAG